MIYQLKIQVEGFKNPEIWRRITVPANFSFSQLHQIIKIVFDQQTKEFHDTYEFRNFEGIDELNILPIDFNFIFANDKVLFAKTTKLSAILNEKTPSCYYVIATKESWEIKIDLEQIISECDLEVDCVAGEGGYPPELCTSIEHYEEMRQILKDKNHEKYQFTRKWLEIDEDENFEDKYKFDINNIKENLEKEADKYKAFRNYNVVQSTYFDKENGLNKDLWTILNNCDKILIQEYITKKDLDKAEKLILPYIKIPIFKQELAAIYLHKNNYKRACQITKEVLQEDPNFVLAKISLAGINFQDIKTIENLPDLLNESFDMAKCFPNRNNKFSADEIVAYHTIAFRYLLFHNNNAAEEHLNYLILNFSEVASHLKQLKIDFVEKRVKNFQEGIDDKNNKKDMADRVKVIPEKVSQTTAPIFENPKISILYNCCSSITKENLIEVMELPRESLIRDLQKVIIDSIARLPYFKKEYEKTNILIDAPIHAMNILSALKAEEALDSVLTVLRQDNDYFDFWLGYLLTEDFWNYIYVLGENQLDKLKAFIQEPNRDSFARKVVINVVLYLKAHQEDRKEEVIKWFEDLLQFFLDNKDNKDIFEKGVYSALMWSYVDNTVGIEKIDTVMSLYDESLLPEWDHISPRQIKISLTKPNISQSIQRELLTTIDQFYDNWKKYNKECESYNNGDGDYDDDFDDYDGYADYVPPKTDKVLPIFNPSKVGRNDPCPCGSGKKYKKCCGGN